jgi:hypothetical protein
VSGREVALNGAGGAQLVEPGGRRRAAG